MTSPTKGRPPKYDFDAMLTVGSERRFNNLLHKDMVALRQALYYWAKKRGKKVVAHVEKYHDGTESLIAEVYEY